VIYIPQSDVVRWRPFGHFRHRQKNSFCSVVSGRRLLSALVADAFIFVCLMHARARADLSRHA